jgi:hypothetical protein
MNLKIGQIYMFVDYRKAEVRSQRSVVRGQMSEVRGQRSEVRCLILDFRFLMLIDLERVFVVGKK